MGHSSLEEKAGRVIADRWGGYDVSGLAGSTVTMVVMVLMNTLT